jgi:hypothetical protein
MSLGRMTARQIASMVYRAERNGQLGLAVHFYVVAAYDHDPVTADRGSPVLPGNEVTVNMGMVLARQPRGEETPEDSAAIPTSYDGIS